MMKTMNVLLLAALVTLTACKKDEDKSASSKGKSEEPSSKKGADSEKDDLPKDGAPVVLTVKSVEADGEEALVKIAAKNVSKKKIGSITYTLCMYDGASKDRIGDDAPSQGSPTEPGATDKFDDHFKIDAKYKDKLDKAIVKIVVSSVFYDDESEWKWKGKDDFPRCDETPELQP